jgi:ABC-type transport system involved in Fe-S cluster assembly fused permease/ATPase subunit
VDRLLADRTGVIIAHRLNTVQRADEVLILEDGAIREAGERAQLADDPNSYFHHLLQTGMEDVLV